MELINGNTFSDQRGILRFVNDFQCDGIKRFYTITHPDTSIIRAWQGHKLETKHFFVTKGKFLICWVEIDNWENPGKDMKVHQQILSADSPQVMIIPGGNANGIKALEADSQVMIFSDLSLEEAKDDNYRWGKDYFNGWKNAFHSVSQN